MGDLSIQPLKPKSHWGAQMAADQYEYWGPLTGYDSPASYEAFLEQAACSLTLPRVLLATTHTTLLGSVNLLTTEIAVRPQFTPWVGQLFVPASNRAKGIGTSLLNAAISYIDGL